MSTPILYDSLLVHYLARELNERLRARRLRRVRFDSDARRFILELDEDRLVWELHPSRGWVRWAPGTGDDATAATEGWGGRRIRTQRRPRVRQVTAPPDERLLEIQIDAGGPDRASRFVVELMTNQWNVLALDPAGGIVSALWTRDAGGRSLRSGEVYAPPGGLEPREGLEEPVPVDRFRALLDESRAGAGAEGGDAGSHGGASKAAERALVRTLAWTSSLNAGPILAADSDEGAWERYRALAERPAPSPRVLELRAGQPYPLPLPGVADRPVESVLAALEAAPAEDGPATLAPEVRDALEERLERLTRKARSLREQAEAAPAKAAALRHRADVLMARMHAVPAGAERVELADFEGGTLALELDPSLSAPENAAVLYERAKKRERAAQRLPGRVREAEAERDQLETVLAALDEGSADPADVAEWVQAVKPGEGGGTAREERLPYRSFRSSGGLEIRVGRSGRANDDLTFHHSAPDDIWLHAREVGGAHVILRWGDRIQNPPKRDLLEAAVLAAVNSRARTSGTVPVDWTRRKHVRSPRNAPPGSVIPDRVSTVFVEPDREIEERLSGA